MSEPTKLDIINNYKKAIKDLEAFHARFSKHPDMPEDLFKEFVYTMNSDHATVALSLRWWTESNRNNALQVVGQIFGRDGWVAKSDYNNDNFDWTKMVGGVKVAIWAAEPFKKPETAIPVPPSKFPIMLTAPVNDNDMDSVAVDRHLLTPPCNQ